MKNARLSLITLAVAALATSALLASARSGSGSPASPASSTSTAPTRVIAVSTGEVPFGTVNMGESARRTFTITNSGNAPLTFSRMTASGGTGTSGLAVSPSSGTVAAGGTQVVTLRFKPATAQYYSTVLSVTGDQTSGVAFLNVSGTGVNDAPLFQQSGSGDTVFDMPTSVKRVRVTGRYTVTSSNFIVHVAGRSLVNELLGTYWSQVDFAETYPTTGGVVEIMKSSGVEWTVTEVR